MICDTDTDLGMATQLSNILKLLIDPENMLSASPINVSEILVTVPFPFPSKTHVLLTLLTVIICFPLEV